MCIAIYKPANTVIDRETLHRCYLKNRDGCGFAYFTNQGDLRIIKAMDFKSFYEDYELHSVINSDRPFLIHFRIATHGTVDLYNCHPFQIDDSHVMIHNGIIHNIRKCPDKLRSDTQMFVDDILKELPKGWSANFGITNLIEDYIGSSKVVVLDVNDNVSIYNEQKGEWANGVWYSNSGYKEVIKTYHWDTDDYYSQRYGEKKHTPHNYERPNIDSKTGELLGPPLYGRWVYDGTFGKSTWVDAVRPVKTKADIATPNSTWEQDEDGIWGWHVVEDDVKPDTVTILWKYDKLTNMMMQYKNGVYTGVSYPAGAATKQKQLELLEKEEHDVCCSCCQSFKTSEIFVVDEFRESLDCYICKDCIVEYEAIGMSMTNPMSVSDLRKLEAEAMDNIFETIGRS